MSASTHFKNAACRFAVLACSAGLLFAEPASAAAVTYVVNQQVGTDTVVGTITTNGDFGTLDTSDIVGFDLSLGGPGVNAVLSNAHDAMLISGADVTATSSGLYFNYGGADDGYMLFQRTLFSGAHYWCNATSDVTCLQGASIVPERFDGASAQFQSEQGNQLIGVVSSVPEPASGLLVIVGLLALAARRVRKTAAGGGLR